MIRVSTIAEQDVVRLVRAHQAEVWRYLRFLGASTELADDLCQETFLQLLRAPFAERTAAETNGWLRAVARSLYVKSLRRPPFASAELDEIEATWTGFADDDGGAASLAQLRDCLGSLDGRARQVVQWHYQDHCSRREIATRLGLGEDGVKSMLRRTRDWLRRCMERQMGERR